MKYLVIARGRETVQTVASALQAAKEYVSNELKSGRADCVYLFPSGDGSGMGIANADSHEQLPLHSRRQLLQQLEHTRQHQPVHRAMGNAAVSKPIGPELPRLFVPQLSGLVISGLRVRAVGA